MPRYKDSEISEALKKSRGMVYVAARELGCAPHTIKARLKKSAKLRALQEDARGIFLDKGEIKLAEAVENGEPWAIKYALSTLARDRGYVEKNVTEVQGKGGGPVEIRVVYDD